MAPMAAESAEAQGHDPVGVDADEACGERVGGRGKHGLAEQRALQEGVEHEKR